MHPNEEESSGRIIKPLIFAKEQKMRICAIYMWRYRFFCYLCEKLVKESLFCVCAPKVLCAVFVVVVVVVFYHHQNVCICFYPLSANQFYSLFVLFTTLCVYVCVCVCTHVCVCAQVLTSFLDCSSFE